MEFASRLLDLKEMARIHTYTRSYFVASRCYELSVTSDVSLLYRLLV